MIMTGGSSATVIGEARSVASVYRLACRTHITKPLRCLVGRLQAACGIANLDDAPMSSLLDIDVSGLYIGNKQLMALFAVAARAPRLTRLAAREQHMYSADVVAVDEAARPSSPGASSTCTGDDVLTSLIAEMRRAEGYRDDGLALEIDLRDNPELGPRAARELQFLATECPFISCIRIDRGCSGIDPVSRELIEIQCSRNAERLAAR